MSVPATNALPPAPRRTMTLSSSSASTASQCSTSWSYIANVIALCASGRSNVTQATFPRRSNVTSATVELREDLIGVLAQQRGRAADRAGRGAELDRDAEPADGAGFWVLHLDHHLTRAGLRVVGHLRVVEDRPGRNTRLEQ